MDKSLLVELIVSKLIKDFAVLKGYWNEPQGTSTKHFFVDNLLPDDIAFEIYNAFPKDALGFYNRESFREKKKTSADLSEYKKILSDITYAIQDEKVVNLIAKITGFTSIEPDPKLYAGGLSMMFAGDYLNPHIDNSHDADRERYRRLNILFYVSPDWKAENGGNFELWDDLRLTPKTIISKFNRMVVMETNKSSWHSVSAVVVDNPRCCVSNYYFSSISPEDSDYYHVTSFLGRPHQKIRSSLGRLDNILRNIIATTFNITRGKNLTNKNIDEK